MTRPDLPPIRISPAGRAISAFPPEPDAMIQLAGVKAQEALAMTQPPRAVDAELPVRRRRADSGGAYNGGLRPVASRAWEHRFRLALFAANGMNVFAVGLLIQVILVRYAGMGHVSSYIVQTVASVQMSFLLSRYVTWRDRNVAFLRALARFNVQQLALTGLGMAGYAGLERLGVNYIAANVAVTAVLTPVSFLSSHKWSMRERTHLRWRAAAVPLPLLAVLAIQAALSLRLVRARTAFGDEALYLWAGHLEWAHWLHGTRIPAFQTWFSGAPVIYPPIGAIADNIGGLVAARVLSLCFMLGATSFLWATASRLWSRRAGFYAAALFAVLGPTLHLGAFATYDAMALLLIAAATWCASAARVRSDATGWILAAAGLLTLANATKYASALFDPIVIAIATLSAYPKPGSKAALRRGALLMGTAAALIVTLIRIGGTWYVEGITQTTTARSLGSNSPAQVLLDSWQWTAVVVVPALAATALCVMRRQQRHLLLLAAVLAASALLVPADQARIHTTTSLNKHVDFGAWFAAIAAAYFLDQLTRWMRYRYAQAGAVVALSAAFIPLMSHDLGQARQMIDWPPATGLIRVLRPLTAHGGHFLAETDDVPEYYLPDTTWRQWSNTFSITRPDGRVQDLNGNPAAYGQAIRDHYFSVVVLSFTQTAGMDQAIMRDLHADHAYHLVAKVDFGGPGRGAYDVWAYVPHQSDGAR